MATILSQNPYVERRTGERRRLSSVAVARDGFDGLRVSWGGVWGGVLVTLGSLILLGALGVAVGMTALNPATADPGRIAAVAAVWGAASFLAALFFGALSYGGLVINQRVPRELVEVLQALVILLTIGAQQVLERIARRRG